MFSGPKFHAESIGDVNSSVFCIISKLQHISGVTSHKSDDLTPSKQLYWLVYDIVRILLFYGNRFWLIHFETAPGFRKSKLICIQRVTDHPACRDCTMLVHHTDFHESSLESFL